MKTFKKAMSLLLSLSFVLFEFGNIVNANFYSEYTKIDQRYLAEGVTEKIYKMITPQGYIEANVVEAEISDKIKFQPLYASKTSSLKTVKTLANDNNAIAAINADFFAWAADKGQGSSIGPLVDNGKLLSSAHNVPNVMSAVGFDGNALSVFYPVFSGTITAENGNSAPIKHFNKFDTLDGIVVYTNSFRDYSVAPVGAGCEYLVVDGVVQDTRHGTREPFTIPDNGYVLSFLKDHNMFVPDNIDVGQKVKLDISISPENLVSAIGGGTQLVKAGAPHPITHSVGGYNPRSAVGIDKTGKKIFLITVDGRGLSKGMTLKTLQEFMIWLGIYDGINLDGGGSTTMVTRQIGQRGEVSNKLSDGGQRAVTNAIGIVPTKKTDKLGYLTIVPDQSTAFNNTSLYFNVYGYDEYSNYMEIDKNLLKFSVSGVDGEFKGTELYPKTAGTATITATLGEVSGSVNVKILDTPHSLTVTPPYINIENTATFSINGKDKNGVSARIFPSDIQVTFTNNIGKLDHNTIVKTGSGHGVMTLKLGEAVTNVGISTDGNGEWVDTPPNVFVKDPLKKPSSGNGTVVNFFGEMPKTTNLIQALYRNKLVDKMNSRGNLNGFVGNVYGKNLGKLNAKTLTTYQFGDYVDGDAQYIWLDNSSGSLSSLKGQWQFLFEKSSAPSAKNVFVMLNKDLNEGGFTKGNEKELFLDALYKMQNSGHQVFLIAPSWVTNVERFDGIRHITVAGLHQGTKETIVDVTKKMNYVQFTIENGEATYNIVPVF